MIIFLRSNFRNFYVTTQRKDYTYVNTNYANSREGSLRSPPARPSRKKFGFIVVKPIF